jgi:hypothetical protein
MPYVGSMSRHGSSEDQIATALFPEDFASHPRTVVRTVV